MEKKPSLDQVMMKASHDYNIPYFEDGFCIEADVLVDSENYAIAFLTGDLAVKKANGEPLFIKMRGNFIETVIEQYEANNPGKTVSYINDRSDRNARPYREEDKAYMESVKGTINEMSSANSFAQKVYTVRGEIHNYGQDA